MKFQLVWLICALVCLSECRARKGLSVSSTQLVCVLSNVTLGWLGCSQIAKGIPRRMNSILQNTIFARIIELFATFTSTVETESKWSCGFSQGHKFRYVTRLSTYAFQSFSSFTTLRIKISHRAAQFSKLKKSA